jgi:hypothetical protein
MNMAIEKCFDKENLNTLVRDCKFVKRATNYYVFSFSHLGGEGK